MRALAEYIMRGRTQAVLTAVFATGTVLFAWVGAAAVALVTLRKGPAQGSSVLLWALVPALVLAVWGDIGPVTGLLGTLLVAVVLRMTSSWPLALLAAVFSGLMTGILLLTVGQGYIEELLRMLGEMLAQIDSPSAEQPVTLPGPSLIAGLLGLSNTFTVVMCLLLARWWQSVLYNPGGFRSEFHALRLPPVVTSGLLVVAILLTMLGPDYRMWALIAAVPLMFVGFALVHGLLAQKQLRSNWLFVFYISWLLLDPLKALLLIAAVIDSWVNIRGRLAAR
jgi:hypothetical protein